MVKNARQRKRSLLMALPPAFADSNLILADRSREGQFQGTCLTWREHVAAGPYGRTPLLPASSEPKRANE